MHNIQGDKKIQKYLKRSFLMRMPVFILIHISKESLVKEKIRKLFKIWHNLTCELVHCHNSSTWTWQEMYLVWKNNQKLR